MMSWTVFWIDPTNGGPQISVAVTSMLTLIAYRFAIGSEVPKLPYLTRLDGFILAGSLLVFLSLIEVMLTDQTRDRQPDGSCPDYRSSMPHSFPARLRRRFRRNLPALKMPNASMKQETPDHPLYVRLRVYALALLLATFISAIHAGILFGLADFFTVFREWVKPALGARPADILVVIAAISGLFVAHIAEAAMWAAFFWKSGHLASFSDGWYFAGVSHTTLGYGDVVLPKPWRSLGPISAINGLLTFGCSTAFLFLVLQIIWQHPL
jgi:hypothetical protein